MPYSSLNWTFHCQWAKEHWPHELVEEKLPQAKEWFEKIQESIRSLMHLAAKWRWRSPWLSCTGRKSWLMLLQIMKAAVQALPNNWITRLLLKLHLCWKSNVTTSTTMWGRFEARPNNGKSHQWFLIMQSAAQSFPLIRTQAFPLVCNSSHCNYGTHTSMNHEHATHLPQSMLVQRMRRTSRPCAETFLWLLEIGPSALSAIFSWSGHWYQHVSLLGLLWWRIYHIPSQR